MSNAIWVIGSYDGEKAKKVAALANEGVGYYPVDDKKGVYAFRYAGDMPLPYGLIEIKDPFKIEAFEKRRLGRMGHQERKPVKASDEAVESVRAIFSK